MLIRGSVKCESSFYWLKEILKGVQFIKTGNGVHLDNKEREIIMLRLTLVSIIAFFSCKKDTDSRIPASVIDKYSSSSFCDYNCSTQIWLVSYDGNQFYGSKLAGPVCPDILIEAFYYSDGSRVESSDLESKLFIEGEYEQLLWQCSR